jgi:hypothetical protein
MTGDAPLESFESTVRFDPARIRAAAIYCSDGRFGEQCDELLHHGLALPRYDRLALPGGPAFLASHFLTYQADEAAFVQLRFLVEVHGLERLVLIAHENCAYYGERLRLVPPQMELQQHADLREAARRVRSLFPHLHVESFFARKENGDTIRFDRVE